MNSIQYVNDIYFGEYTKGAAGRLVGRHAEFEAAKDAAVVLISLFCSSGQLWKCQMTGIWNPRQAILRR